MTNTEPTKTAGASGKRPTKPEAKTSEQGLITGWADATVAPSFDHDQSAVHAWNEADAKEREKVLISEMTIADAEELIATCNTVATEHRRRAQRADRLAGEIANRLGYVYKAEYEPKNTDTEAPEPRTVFEEKTVRLQTVPEAEPKPVSAAPVTKSIPTFLREESRPNDGAQV